MFVTLSELKTTLGIPAGATNRDDTLAAIVESVNAWMATTLRRDFTSESYSEAYRGTDREDFVLAHIPVTAVTALSVDGKAIDLTTDETVVWSDNGIVTRTDGTCWKDCRKRNIAVTYTAGLTDVPDELAGAAREVAAYLYKTTGGGQGVTMAGMTEKLWAGDSLHELPNARAAIEYWTDHARAYVRPGAAAS